MNELEYAREAVNEETFDFYRCQKCNGLITKLQEMAAFTVGHKNEGQICPCGGYKFVPTNMLWYEWALPRVWRFAYLRYRGLA